jgi:hypothetical protein
VSTEHERMGEQTAAELRQLAVELRARAVRMLAEGDLQRATELHELALRYERFAESLDHSSPP